VTPVRSFSIKLFISRQTFPSNKIAGIALIALIEVSCVSLLGSTQPGRLAEYIRRANDGGVGDDGLIQRFGLLVWPDQNGDWTEIDRYPDSEARAAAGQAFERLDKLQPDMVGAEVDQFEPVPFLRFNDEAQRVFSSWRRAHEIKLRGRRTHASSRKPSREIPQACPFARADKPSRGRRLWRHFGDCNASGAGLRGIFRNPRSARLRRRIRDRDFGRKDDPETYP
jgi:hypothetical protein